MPGTSRRGRTQHSARRSEPPPPRKTSWSAEESGGAHGSHPRRQVVVVERSRAKAYYAREKSGNTKATINREALK